MLSSIAAYGDRYHDDIDSSLSVTMARSARRGPWLPEEDQALLQLVRTQGANNWVRISQQIQHRSPKQCRERYHQNLKPSLKHDPISAQEGEMIERLVQDMGKRWAEIARRLGNRSDNAVKNWWNGSVNRRRRNPSQTTTGFKQVGTRLQPLPFTLGSEVSYHQSSRSTLELAQHTSPTSYETRQMSNRPSRPSVLQIPTPIHTRTSSAAGPSTHIRFEPPSTNSVPAVSNSTSQMNPGRIRTSELRPELPPIRSSSFHLARSERSSMATERPPISPALSDTSQKCAPSLVSDTQSTYSISPRTVSTPRPGVLATTEIGGSLWPDTQSATQQHRAFGDYKAPYPLDSYHRYGASTPVDAVYSKINLQYASNDVSKDSRMNVSTLLQ